MNTISIKVQVSNKIHKFLTEIQKNMKLEDNKKTSLSEILMNFAIIGIENTRIAQNKSLIEQTETPIEQNSGQFAAEMELQEPERGINNHPKSLFEKALAALPSNNQEKKSKSEKRLRRKRKELERREADINSLRAEIDEDRRNIYKEQKEIIESKQALLDELAVAKSKDAVIAKLMQENSSLRINANREIVVPDFKNINFNQISELNQKLSEIEDSQKEVNVICERIFDFIRRPKEKNAMDYIVPFLPALSTAAVTYFMNKKKPEGQKLIEDMQNTFKSLSNEDKEKTLKAMGI